MAGRHVLGLCHAKRFHGLAPRLTEERPCRSGHGLEMNRDLECGERLVNVRFLGTLLEARVGTGKVTQRSICDQRIL